MSVRSGMMWWAAGLAAFVVVIWMHLPLTIAQVPGGIGDHQSAGSAARVDAIQSAWSEAGLQGRALSAMITDVVFVLIYGTGCIAFGKAARAVPGKAYAVLGRLLWIAGWIFLLTDLAETTAQIAQLTSGEGSDTLAGLAAGVGPAKITAMATSFLAGPVLAVMVWLRQRAGGAAVHD